MGLGDVVFNRAGSALGGALPTKDHISAFTFYSNETLPSGFDANNRIKKIFSLKEAENLGIVDDHADETKATGGQVVITGAGVVTETVVIRVNGAPIGYHTITSAVIGDIVTALTASINDLNNSKGTGFVAVESGGTDIDITIPDKIGATTCTITFEAVTAAGGAGTATATVTSPSSGVGSWYAVMHYHISEYFRLQPKGELYVGIYAEPVTFTAVEVKTMQDFAKGEIRKFGLFIKHTAFASSQITAIQTVLTQLRTEHQPNQLMLHADGSALTLTTLADLSTLDSADVGGLIISEDGNYHQNSYVGATVSGGVQSYQIGEKRKWLNQTFVCIKNVTNSITSLTGSPLDTTAWSLVSLNLPDILGYSISDIGAKLGAWSFSAVNESIANPEKFKMDSGNILSEAGFVTGDLFADQSESLLDSLDNKNYLFLRNFKSTSGTYNTGEWTCTLRSSDYKRLSRGQVMDKAERLVYSAMVPLLSLPVIVDSDGKLSDDAIATYENTADASIDDMRAKQEISGAVFTANPDQNVQTTETIVISMSILGTAIARDITVNSGFVKEL